MKDVKDVEILREYVDLISFYEFPRLSRLSRVYVRLPLTSFTSVTSFTRLRGFSGKGRRWCSQEVERNVLALCAAGVQGGAPAIILVILFCLFGVAVQATRPSTV